MSAVNKPSYGFTQGNLYDIYAEEAEKADEGKPTADNVFAALCIRNPGLRSRNKMVIFYYTRSVYDRLKHLLTQGKDADFHRDIALAAAFPAEKTGYPVIAAAAGQPRTRAPARPAIQHARPRLMPPFANTGFPFRLSAPGKPMGLHRPSTPSLREVGVGRPPYSQMRPKYRGRAGFAGTRPRLRGGQPHTASRDQRQSSQKIHYGLTKQPVGLHDERGYLVKTNLDVCDCLDLECEGCFFECQKCGGTKCGLECRVSRRWQHALRVDETYYETEDSTSSLRRETRFNPETGLREVSFERTDVWKR